MIDFLPSCIVLQKALIWWLLWRFITPRALERKEHLLSMRLPETDIAIIDRAAALRGRSRADFVRDAAVRAALLVPLKLTPSAVTAAPNVPRTRIARKEEPVTADTALRLGKIFKTGAAFWTNMQAHFDLETAEDVLAPQIKKIASYKVV